MYTMLGSLRVETTYLFYVPSVGEDFALLVGQLVGPGSQHSGDNVRPFPWRGQLVAALVALPQS